MTDLNFGNMVFDEVAHAYFLDGKQLPSVTQLLKFVVSFDFVPPDVLEAKRQLGVAVHKACELLDEDDLDENRRNCHEVEVVKHVLWEED